MLKKSKFKVNVGSKSKIVIDWRDRSENYSYETKKHIISVCSDRYSIPKEVIKVQFTPLNYNDKGELVDMSTDVINNIQDPNFQIKLFNDYIIENSIKDVDFEFIKKIDSEMNSKIDYDVYDKYRKYEIQWIEWDNFLSYGFGNRFDFRSLKGLTLVNGAPANQSGKSSFTIDLISFLLFGKSQKPYTLSECFNKFTDEKYFKVRGGINIEGINYVVERIVTRSKKRTGEWGDASQEVKYYELINDQLEELPEYNKNVRGEHSIKTNKIIKESIGNEKDFNMIISATGNDLDSLIDVGNTERGRLLSKWIGLSPLEEKDKLAKEQYKEFEKPLKSKRYDETELIVENENLTKLINESNNSLTRIKDRIVELDSLILIEQQAKESLLTSKRNIDDSILKLDLNTVNLRLTKLESDANLKKESLKEAQTNYDLVKDVTFNNEDYKVAILSDKNHAIEINRLKNDIQTLKITNKNLLESEYCPTCKRKYDGADNSSIILENNKKIEKLIKKGVTEKVLLDKNKLTIEKLDSDRISYDKKLKLESLIEVIPIQIENLRSEYREKLQLIKEYNENKDAITINNNIDISLTNINAKLRSFDYEKDQKIKEVENLNRTILDSGNVISKNNIIIDEIKAEFIKIRNWKIYLEMVGKNGISKTVLKKTLPIINSELSRMLEDVCDFEVEVVLTDKNDVTFKIIKNGIASNLAGASGLERTASALALRCVLGNISTMPRPNFISLDEILGKVAKENYENMLAIYNKIESNYQFILHISHIEDIKDWHKNIITISKTNDISSIITTINNK